MGRRAVVETGRSRGVGVGVGVAPMERPATARERPRRQGPRVEASFEGARGPV